MGEKERKTVARTLRANWGRRVKFRLSFLVYAFRLFPSYTPHSCSCPLRHPSSLPSLLSPLHSLHSPPPSSPLSPHSACRPTAMNALGHPPQQGTISPGTTIQLGRFTVVIDRYIAEGGFAHVYLANLGGLPVVVKRIAVADKERLAIVNSEIETMVGTKKKKNKKRHNVPDGTRFPSLSLHHVLMTLFFSTAETSRETQEHCRVHGLDNGQTGRRRLRGPDSHGVRWR